MRFGGVVGDKAQMRYEIFKVSWLYRASYMTCFVVLMIYFVT